MREVTQLWKLVEDWRHRQRFKPSQAALARDIGVARGALTQWKYDESRPTPAHMRALQSATGIRYRDLLDAMLTDMGYLPKGVGDGNAAATTSAGESPATKHQVVRVRTRRPTSEGPDEQSPDDTQSGPQ